MAVQKRSVNISGHATSITMEAEFWTVLKQLAKHQKLTINDLVAQIDEERDPQTNLSSAIRVYILKSLQN